mgnify:CR=1 FL=1
MCNNMIYLVDKTREQEDGLTRELCHNIIIGLVHDFLVSNLENLSEMFVGLRTELV